MSLTSKPYGEFIDRVNERAKGELVIDYLGGPEVIPTFEQPEAIKSGVVDMIYTSPSFYSAAMPEGRAWMLSEIMPVEERARGFVDYVEKLHNDAMNLHYVGRAFWLSGRYIFTKERVEKPEDLAGLKARAMPTDQNFLKALGMVPVTVPTAEAYTSLERGVVNSYAGTFNDVESFKLYEVLKYGIDEPWCASSLIIIMNLDKWNTIPKHLQNLITDVSVEFDTYIPEAVGAREQKAKQNDIAGGMEMIKFSPEDAERYVKLFYDTEWEVIKGKVSPESYAKLRELLKK